MKTYLVEAVRFDNDGTIAEGYSYSDSVYISESMAVENALNSYNELCDNDKKSRGYIVNMYEDDEYIGCVFAASRFTEMTETVPSGATIDEFYIDDMED